jgi:hypothetical protein
MNGKDDIEGKSYGQLAEETTRGNLPKDMQLSEDGTCELLLKTDYRRARFVPYEKALLTEHTQGHWDLADRIDQGAVTAKLSGPVYARNPYRDIQRGSVIGIDFGTKSTIVSLLDARGQPIPVPVGGRYEAPQQRDYENPTVLHLRDMESFSKAYSSRPGRPETSWETFTVSHTAKEDLDNSNDANYYSFVTNLKQWAAAENEKLELTDDEGELITIPPYLRCQGEDPDLIEIYAYYIGLAINNMRRASIYTNYLLSFPVTYEKKVQEKIRDSFERGIIKSLPNVMAKDAEFLKNEFLVKRGTSEPAAYAVCALKYYGFNPEDQNEAHYYGVFDFGGGTSDFDLGLWRAANGEGEEEDRDFVIDHFGAGGDRFLGGENILENMAFRVFSSAENQEKLRSKRISFTFPSDPNKKTKFPGYESLVSQNSKWANLNMHKMKEVLRPIWEKAPDYQNKVDQGMIKDLILFNDEGQQESDLGLILDLERLDDEIETRIRSGVKDFLAGMVRAMAGRGPEPRKLNIFLAGNSCKAEVVKKVFNEECAVVEADFRQKLLKDKGREFEAGLFEIFPPLGAEEASKKMEERGISCPKTDAYRPTGKTGVAIGLVLSRSGSPILVKNSNVDKSGEVHFKFVVGKNSREKLIPVLDMESAINGAWKEFMNANRDSIELYFTSKVSGISGEFPVAEAERIIRRLPQTSARAKIYIRPVSPTEIEYKIASGANEKPLFDTARIKLEEG